MPRKPKWKKTLEEALPDDPQVREEYFRLLSVYSGAPAERLKLARKLISRAAFLSVECDRLEQEIIQNGFQEPYQNGDNQRGNKKTPAAELHILYTRNLNSVMRQLERLLGTGPLAGGGDDDGDDFDNF